MTDLQKFVELYKSFGIDCLVNYDVKHFIYWITLTTFGFCDKDTDTISNKLEGHSGFFTKIEFDIKGTFIKQGVWE